MRVLMLLSLVLACAAFVGTRAAGAQPLEPGDPAPEFRLPGSDGRTYSLADFKGKRTVVVAWFPRAFTSGCTAECKSMKETGPSIRQFDVAYFAASVDDAEKNRQFAESLELDFPILSDPGRAVARAYGVVTDDTRGASRWTFYIGRDGRILYIDKQVKTGTHGQDIAARLKTLGVPPSHE